MSPIIIKLIFIEAKLNNSKGINNFFVCDFLKSLSIFLLLTKIKQSKGKMYSVIKTIEFCYGHRLLNYEGKCRHLHGHNAKADIELSSQELDKLGMVYDFSEIKQSVKKWIDDNIDHVMLLNKEDEIIPILKELNERYLAVDGNPTAEFIAKMIFDQVDSLGFPVTSVRVWETPNSNAVYSR